MPLLRGHLYWSYIDKRRTALVISVDPRNARASNVLVIPCSTRIRPGPTHVVLRAGEGGLERDAVLKCEQISNIDREDVLEDPLGEALSAERLAQVERAVLLAIGIPVPLP
jgi:mRNA-degrading endonuclease toxin of MazEF toxin-antitoxin module